MKAKLILIVSAMWIFFIYLAVGVGFKISGNVDLEMIGQIMLLYILVPILIAVDIAILVLFTISAIKGRKQ